MSKKGKATKMDLAAFLSSTPGTAAPDIYAQLPSQPGEVVPSDDRSGRRPGGRPGDRFGGGDRYGGDRYGGDRYGGDRYGGDRRDHPSEGDWARRGPGDYDRPRDRYEGGYGSRGSGPRSGGFGGSGRDDYPPIGGGAPAERPRLNLQPRTAPVAGPTPAQASQASKSDPFGGARPVDVKTVEDGVSKLAVSDRERQPAPAVEQAAPAAKGDRWDKLFTERKPGAYQPKFRDAPPREREGGAWGAPRDAPPRDRYPPRDVPAPVNDRWGRDAEADREPRGPPREFDRRGPDFDRRGPGDYDRDRRGPGDYDRDRRGPGGYDRYDRGGRFDRGGDRDRDFGGYERRGGPGGFDRRDERSDDGRAPFDREGPRDRRDERAGGPSPTPAAASAPAPAPAAAPAPKSAAAEKPAVKPATEQAAPKAAPAEPVVDAAAKAEEERKQREEEERRQREEREREEKEAKRRAEMANAEAAVQSGKKGEALEAELRANKPTASGSILLEAILNHVPTPEDGKWAAPSEYGGVLQKLLSSSNREQVRAIYAVQKYCHERGFPKAGKSNLVEALFAKLYTNELVFDDAFLTWKDEEDESVPGKQKAIIQTLNFMSMLEEEVEQGEEEEEEGSELDDEDLLPVAL